MFALLKMADHMKQK